MPDFTTLLGLKDTFDDSATPAPEGLSVIQEDEEDFFGGEDYDTGAPMPGGFDDMSNPADDQDGGFAGPSSAAYGGVGSAGPGEHMPFDGRRQGGELVMALMGDGDGDGMFDYFDKGFAQNWAGAEHWKLRKVTRKGELNDPACLKLTFRSNRTDCAQSTQSRQSTLYDRFLSPCPIYQDTVRLIIKDINNITESETSKARGMALTG